MGVTSDHFLEILHLLTQIEIVIVWEESVFLFLMCNRIGPRPEEGEEKRREEKETGPQEEGAKQS